MPAQTHKNHKKGVSTCRKFWCLSARKKSTSSLTTFLRYYKDVARCYFDYFRHIWLHPSNMIVPTFSILWCLSVQKSTSSFEYFGHEWRYSTILIATTCWKVCLSAYKKSTSCLPSLLKYCKDIANLLFWELWAYMAMATKNYGIRFKETLILIFMQKKFLSPLSCQDIANLLLWVL